MVTVCSLMVGDTNLGARELTALAQRCGGMFVRGHDVDAAIIRGGKVTEALVLPKGKSDHHPVVYTLDVAGHEQVVLSWNVYVGQAPRRVKRRLRRLIKKYQPDAIALQEAYRCGPLLAVLAVEYGYDLIQGPNAGEDADCALLVRADRPLRRRGTARMREHWIGPKHDLPKQPRRYPRSRREVVPGVHLRLLDVHPPTGGRDGRNATAVIETEDRIANWFQKGHH